MTPIDSHGANPTGYASPPASPPATPGTAGAFDHSLQQALASPSRAPAGPITLGQMLNLYTLPTGALPTAMPASASRGASGVRGPAGAVALHAGGDLGVGPVARPLPGAVGSEYGPRVHPIHGGVRMHDGVDISAPTGTPIRAFADGTVTFAGPRGGYGNVVIVEHANGIESRYAHQSGIDVAVGQHVGAGEVVGRVGATGTATGPHLHLEVRRNGEPIDPTAHLP